MKTKTQKLVKWVANNFDAVKNLPKTKEDYVSGIENCIGKFYWDNPNLAWVYVAGSEEGYEGSQTQLGISRDGKIKWSYQSHCSCNDYEDENEIGEDFPTTEKNYELDRIPEDWEKIVCDNILKLKNAVKKANSK